MPDAQPVFRQGRGEEYAIYTGQVSGCFAPGLAGITYPDPLYEIYRPRGDHYVFEYVLSGMGYVRQDGESVTVTAGDAYILQPGRCHHYYSDQEHPWTKIWFNVGGSLVAHLISDYQLDNVLKIPAFGESDYLYDIFHAIEKEPIHSGGQLELLLHRYIQAISSFLGSEVSFRSRALIMKNFIEQNAARPLTIDDIAGCVPLSRSRAIHLFKEAYAVTPYRYYLSLRLALSKSLLERTAMPIQEISNRLGFMDYRHFSGFFRKETGISPSCYRKKQGNPAAPADGDS
nr:AraC family transcriptional regulator [uncultured Acetatifactor sp.]